MEKAGFEKVERFFRWNGTKAILFALFIIIGLGFQSWAYVEKSSDGCLKAFCGPVYLGVVYGVFLPFDYLNIWILKSLEPERWILVFDNIIIWFLQLTYWYLLSCLIAIPLRKAILNMKNDFYNRRNEKERRFKESIELNVKKAETG